MWSVEPNRWVREAYDAIPAGRALDIATGEGRNALWLAEVGWRVTAVDFARVALDRGEHSARQRLGADSGRITWVEADVASYRPEPHAYDAVLVVYLHVAPSARSAVLSAAAEALAPRGTLLVVGHDLDNLQRGVGGPPVPEVLYTEAAIADDLADSGVTIRANELRRRPVETDAGVRDALDRVVIAVRET